MAKQIKNSKNGSIQTVDGRDAAAKSAATNGSGNKAKAVMSEADKATLKAWRLTFESRNKVCTE